MIGAALPNMLAGLTAGLANILPTTPSATITVLSVPSMTPITNTLPDIPRSYTAICEWAACMVYIAVLYRRVPLQRSIIVSATGLLLLTAVQYFDGSMPIWFWIIGMLLAFACMYATILLDVILTAKERACADRGITFTAVADGSLLSGMSSMDIASLFGNALDNAIEATSKLPKHEQRLIKLALYEQSLYCHPCGKLLRFPAGERCGRQFAHHQARRPAPARFRREVNSSYRATVWRRSDDSHRRPLVRTDRAHSEENRSYGHMKNRA